MAKTVATIYIDETGIRLLVAQKKGVMKWAEKPLDPGMVNDGIIVQEAEVAETVKKFLKAENVSARKVIAGLSGLHCLSRVITLPKLPKSLLGEAVNREAQRVIPVPLEQFHIVWQVIPGRGTEMQVFLLGIPRNSSDALVRTLRRAGVNPYLMDVKPLALARLADRDTTIVADIQPAEVDIIVIVNGIPQLMRTIAIPAEARTRLKKLSMVEEELGRTIKFYNSSHPQQPLSPDIPILVSGEPVNESSAAPYVTDLKPLAMARATDEDTAIIADIQPTEVDIVVVVDKVPQLMRTISLPGESRLRAEKLATLQDELGKTIKFYNSSHADKPLSPDIPVVISGEPATEPTGQQSPARGNELKSSALPLSSPLKYPTEFDPIRYTVNMGLALKALPLKPNLVNFNVLPEIYRPKKPSLKEAILVPGITVSAALLIPLVVLVQNASANTAALRSQLETTSRVNQQRQVQKKELNELQKKVDDAVAVRDATRKVLTSFAQSQERVNSDLSTVTSLLTVGITMTDLTHGGDRMTVSGNAVGERDVLYYAQSIRDSKRFSQVVITSTSAGNNQTLFRLTLIK